MTNRKATEYAIKLAELKFGKGSVVMMLPGTTVYSARKEVADYITARITEYQTADDEFFAPTYYQSK